MSGYLRFPVPYAEGIVFTCEDDLWSVPAAGGRASRLTAGRGEATRARVSPDGAWIAFTGTEDGPTEVYVMPAAGGPARRLTFQGARCATVDWHPRTGEIVYASAAGLPYGFGQRLFAVDPAGGRPRLLGGPADSVAFGPGGRVVIGHNTGDPARWKRYRGGSAGELWLADDELAPARRLLELPGNLASPCWAGEEVYFLSDHEGVAQVYSCRPDGTGLTRHTDHETYYARQLTSDGRRLSYQSGAELWLLTPGDGPARPVEVELAGARAGCARRFVPPGEYLDDVRLSPDGGRLAVAARGQAVTLAPWSGPVRWHGRAEGVRYRLLDWLADGERLVAVAADEGPEERLVTLAAEGGPAEDELVGGGFGCVSELAAAPAGPLVGYATNRQQLWLVDTSAEGATPRLVDTSDADRIGELAWSPDGRWLAYTFPLDQHRSAIRLAEAATGRVHQVSEPVLRDSCPAFDPQGRFLYFLGQRELHAEYDQVRFDLGFPFGTRPYLVPLRAADPVPFGPAGQAALVASARAQAEAEAEAEAETEGEGGAGDGGESGPVEIELAGIADRATPMPVPEGRYTGLFGVPGGALLLTQPLLPAADDRQPGAPEAQVTLVTWAGPDATAEWLGPLDELAAAPDGETLLYRCGDRLRLLPTDSVARLVAEHPGTDAPTGAHTGWVDLDRARVPLRPAGEWRQMFREAWRLQRESFWDADMAGLDWPAVYERYAPLAERVACRSELSDLIWELQGELGTSHAYEQGGEYPDRPGHSQGLLGVDWDETAPAGEWRIARVLRGDPWQAKATSPCRRPGVDVRPGDTVTAVDGRPVGPAGPGELLVGQADREVELTLRHGGGPARRVTVRAADSEYRARHLDWVAGNRELVAKLSAGRLGYLHVPDMLGTGYADFVRGFLGELDHEGLLVDVRYNTGGHISPLLLDLLARRGGGERRGRRGARTRHPAEASTGALAVLVNEHTGSDGEIFAHGFRQRGLGRLVGRRTWGGVVATWPRQLLADGTVTTQPEFRFYLDGVGDLLENRGVLPDREVARPPRLGPAAEDEQLHVAVRLLLAELAAGAPAGGARGAARGPA
ncbi:PDZ domain-containing protein [Streptomyces sp. DSM 44915]|uniref:Tricorn protease homolog n=1 Tax=Streptomyces chisholmiae TaxID=3075540 RepID=A0ABU2JQV3_9ACTN|nr:PDZ domain-containing protein [Streptomyces sp. DSM 44915]MDT0267360.1 PDZ domain-containing protein [Streptomyces sp. DSM 44915]